MAWKSVLPMEERLRFVFEAQLGLWTMTELCERYGISRKTGYKWLKRFNQQGIEGIQEHSRAPKHFPHRTPEEVVKCVVAERQRHPKWGPKKIAKVLKRAGSGFHVPAPSTIGGILQRHGLVRRRRRRRGPVGRWPGTLTEPQRPNHVWGVDFKGWFRTGNGERCDPLTASDLYSRFILDCRILRGQTMEIVRPVFEKIFTEYGLPEVIRVDNGAPFGSTGPHRLTKLSMWWVQLDIRVEFIEPGHPEQNAVHERMHRTLKDETCCPPKWNHRTQQRRFDQWRTEFNFQRPHEALGMSCPTEHYRSSAIAYPKVPKSFSYPAFFEVRRVREAGQISLNGKPRFIGHAFSGIDVGLEPISSENQLVHAGPLAIGTISHKGKKAMQPTVCWPARKSVSRSKSVTYVHG